MRAKAFSSITPLFLVFIFVLVKGEQYIFNNVTLSLYRTRDIYTEKSISSDSISDETLQKRYRYITCTNQNISAIPSNSIANLTSVKRIIFDKTNTTTLEQNAFHTLPQLKTLQITGNPLRNLPRNPFNCQTLLLLNLSSNALAHLDRDFLVGVPNLRHLDLSGNRIKQIEAAFFARTPALRDLHLSRNRIGEVPEGAFKYLNDNMSVLLDYNEIANFSRVAFKPGVRIDYLALGENNLESFEGVLDGAEAVGWLELSGNDLECLDYAAMAKVTVLMADGNPWECSCLLEFWEKRWKDGRTFFANAELARCLIN